MLLGFHAGFERVQGNKAQASVRLGITIQEAMMILLVVPASMQTARVSF
jgi:hypothetical protein